MGSGVEHQKLSQVATELPPTVKTAEIRQKKEQNQGVESPTLSGFGAMSSV